jgi:hypothetical protein
MEMRESPAATPFLDNIHLFPTQAAERGREGTSMPWMKKVKRRGMRRVEDR